MVCYLWNLSQKVSFGLQCWYFNLEVGFLSFYFIRGEKHSAIKILRKFTMISHPSSIIFFNLFLTIVTMTTIWKKIYDSRKIYFWYAIQLCSFFPIKVVDVPPLNQKKWESVQTAQSHFYFLNESFPIKLNSIPKLQNDKDLCFLACSQYLKYSLPELLLMS